jgi:hypothetical protein
MYMRRPVLSRAEKLISGIRPSAATHVHFFGYVRLGAGDLGVEKVTLLLANGVTTAVVMEGTPAILSFRYLPTASGWRSWRFRLIRARVLCGCVR